MPDDARTKARRTWATVAFGDVVRLYRNRSKDPEADGYQRAVGLVHLDPGALQVRRWSAVSDGTTFTHVFRSGQVLFGKRRAYQRKLAVPDFCGVCSGDIYVLEPASSSLFPELLPFICQTDAFFEYAVSTSAGSLSSRTNWANLAHFEFALPPMAEQRRIVGLLQAQERLCETLRDLLQTTLQVLPARLEERFSVDSSVWPRVPVGELLSEPLRNGLSLSPNSERRGFRTVSVGAVAAGRFDPEGHEKWAEADRSTVEPFLIRRGDVFVVRGNGNRYLTGKAGMADQDYDDMFCPDKLIRLRFDARKISPEFALSQWNLPSVHRRLVSRAKGSNGNWMVNGQDIRAHDLALPPPWEQRSMYDWAGAWNRTASRVRARLAAAQRLKAAALDEALRPPG